MDLKDYFESNQGIGVLSTSDAKGVVNSALYGRPHFLDDGTIAFIMLDRLNHHNLSLNPHAAYLFIENDDTRKGVRLHLAKLAEEMNTERIEKMRRVKYPGDENRTRYLVSFKIEKLLPLIGDDPDKLPF